MNVKGFQKKLAELMVFAIDNDKHINSKQVINFFEETLNEEQMTLIYQYLKGQGITIEDVILEEAQDLSEPETEEEKADPLSEEEEQYLRLYLNSLSGKKEKKGEKERLFPKAADGDGTAIGRLVEIYLPIIAKLCVEHHKEALFLGDMIQDVNLNLYMALGKGLLFNDGKVHQLIKGSIRQSIQEKEQELFQDEYLVTKVRNLEAAVKELTDDDEEESKKFSIEELSILLDMTVEEIQDILRLTGDDK